MCQKIVNVIAIASGVVSLAVVGVGGYVYVNQESIIESVKQKALGSLGGLGGIGGSLGGVGGGALQSVPDMAAPEPAVPEAPLKF